MDLHTKYHYFDLEKHEREAIVSYLLRVLLHAREVYHFPTNEKVYDEDVNVYLAHLLFASALADYQELVHRYLSLNSSDLMCAVDKNEDKVVRYFIYKVNADYLLVHLSVFHDLVPPPAPSFKKPECQWVEIGQSYYDHASHYNHQIYRKQTAVGDVLEKLSHHFEDYKKILEVVSNEFFHFIKKMESLELRDESRNDQLAGLIHALDLEQKRNEFLDLYGEYLKTKSTQLVAPLGRLSDEIKALDPTFGFRLDSFSSAD